MTRYADAQEENDANEGIYPEEPKTMAGSLPPDGYLDPVTLPDGSVTDYTERPERPDQLRPPFTPYAEPCYCFGPWQDLDPADRPETTLGREHQTGSPGCKYSPNAAFEPWTDADTAELAQAMSDAAWRIGDRWLEALREPSWYRGMLRVRFTRPTPTDPNGIAAACRLVDLMDHFTPGHGRQFKPNGQAWPQRD